MVTLGSAFVRKLVSDRTASVCNVSVVSVAGKEGRESMLKDHFRLCS